MSGLPDPRPTQAKQAALVRRKFDRVAPRYDRANQLLSFGSDQHWRRTAVRALAAAPGALVLDVATGTGRLAEELARAGASPVGLDFSSEMLAAGARRRRVPWVNGDGMRLPFADATFDGVTIGFGLRNLPDPPAGLAELARVTRPGGRLVVLEFSTPTAGWFRHLYERYLVGTLPRVAGLVSSDPAAYTYLAESILNWPDQQGLARWIRAAGWRDVAWRTLTGGIVALHRAQR